MVLEKDYILAVNALKNFLMKKGVSQAEAQKAAYEINQLCEKAMQDIS